MAPSLQKLFRRVRSAGFARPGRSESAGACVGAPQLWIVLGDIHGRIRRIGEIPELWQADGIVISGDLTRHGGAAEARVVVEAFQEAHPVVLAQIGNMDRAEVDEWLEEQGINLHRRVRELAPGIALFGVGGATFSPFGTPSEFPEARFSEWLEELARQAGDHREHILISHNPPRNTACDRTHGGTHVGSAALREFIEEHQPSICICGHIHESVGTQEIGRTIVANPGSFASGHYALLTLGEAGMQVTLRTLDAAE